MAERGRSFGLFFMYRVFSKQTIRFLDMDFDLFFFIQLDLIAYPTVFHCISFSCILLSPPYFFHRFGHVCYEKLEGSQVSSLPSLVGLKGNNGREGTVVAVFVLPFSGYV